MEIQGENWLPQSLSAQSEEVLFFFPHITSTEL